MAYIRSNQDYYEYFGDFRTYEQRAKELREAANDEHMPDSVRDECLNEAEQNERDNERGSE